MKSVRFVSLADSAFEKLEDDILSGVYEKGQIITEIELSQKLEISRTPVREAVKRLEQENLVKLSARGIVIVGLSSTDIVDIFEIRSRIEGLAVAKCAENFTDQMIEELRSIVELQEFYTEKHKAHDISIIDSKFHEYIYSNCGNEMLSGILSSLHRKIQKYRKLSVTNDERAQKAVAEHRLIFEAIAKRDKDNAEKLLIKHIDNAKANIIKNFETKV